MVHGHLHGLFKIDILRAMRKYEREMSDLFLSFFSTNIRILKESIEFVVPKGRHSLW